ncbi:MauE/DoxX family redox-associated membrane protein [Streptomyces rubellomurinus]|uniref:MauE/DoxX family redox-associated membrane protein n=1 Tax=Streptomyces rubellomurinus (strain ATCC 31215) TaxID=359131 RepID=UPI0005F0E946|nr:MauE/DoxX family redox-associated membrane protein [Streptomyces rubellomurinus]
MILRLILGITYTAMAAAQLASWPDMPPILAAYQVGGHASMTVLAAVLIAGELAAGLWFLTAPRSRRRAPVWIYTGVSVLWAALAAQAFARALTVPVCGCFGRYLPQHLSWIILTEDALLLLYAALLLHSSRPAPTRPRPVPTNAEGVHPR